MPMKFSIQKSALADGLQMVQSIVGMKSTLPILSNARLQAVDGKLALTTTDLEVSVTCCVEADVSKPGATTLPVRRLYSIVRELPESMVEITVDEKNSASVRCGSSFYKIVGLAEDEFPPIPAYDSGHAYTMQQRSLRDMLRKTSYAASADETRYVLNGSFIGFKGGKVTLVATDGRRLALVEQELEFPSDAECEAIIPSKTINELVKALGDEGEVTVHITGNQIALAFDDVVIISKLIDGTYPNYRQVIPSQSEERVTVAREELLAALRRAALLTNEKSNSVKLTFSKNNLDIHVVTPDVGEARESLPIKSGGKEVTVAFNPEYMMDPLRNLDTDEVAVEFTDTLSPAVIKCDVPFLYVLMPIQVK